jgi:hypothetical protein
MHSPFWVASARVDIQTPLVFGNHTCVLSVEEGRTGPDHACLRDARHINLRTKPETAKLASSQGEAPALDRCAPTQTQIHLKDMKTEFYS